jgi:hypothetical protein
MAKESYGYDPLLTVIKLAILKFNEPGTKLSFYRNHIYIQPPSWTQGTSRYFYSSSKDDLIELFIPVKKCIEKYIIKENNIYIKQILKYSVEGLYLLQETYNNNKQIILLLQLLIDIINDGINGIFKDYTNLNKYFNNDVKAHDDLWNELSINVLHNHLIKCNKEKEEFKDQYAKLECFITAKETRYTNYINNIKV